MQPEQKRSTWPAFLLTSIVAAVMLLGPNAVQAALGINPESPTAKQSNVVVLGGQSPVWTVSVDLADAGYECSTQLGDLLRDETVLCSGPNVEKWRFSTDWREGFSEDQTDLVLRRALRASIRTDVAGDYKVTARKVPGSDTLTAHVLEPTAAMSDDDKMASAFSVIGFSRSDAPGAMVLVTLKEMSEAALKEKIDLIVQNARLEED